MFNFKTNVLNELNSWFIFSFLVCLLLSIPILSLFFNAILSFSAETWNFLVSNKMKDYIYNSFFIIFYQSIFVTLIGVSTAWLVTIYSFPFRKVFDFALLLPLAIPTYVSAIVYGELLDYSGFLQTFFRENYQIANYFFPDIRSLGGAIFIFIFTLYPYVYIISRSAFSEISYSYNEIGQTLGLNNTKIFFKIFIPLTGFSILGGTILSILESLNDFGTVQYFGVDTFTTGIYTTWIGLGEIKTASQLSLFFLFFIFLIIYFQKRILAKKRININRNTSNEFKQIKTGNLKSSIFFLYCFIPILIGFIIPLITLIYWFSQIWDFSIINSSLINAKNTIILSIISCFLIITLSILINYSSRIKNTKINRFFNNISSLGYAIPGSVIAIGVIISLSFFDIISSIFTGSIFILCFAYTVRFFTISQTNIESAFYRIPINYDYTSKILGKKPLLTLFNVHIPIMSTSIIFSSILIFIEVVKELSATLILRPFNFDTLSIQVYEYASEDKIFESSIPSLIIIILCIIGIIFVSKFNKILFR